jgi:hypothetical protein
MAWPPGEHIEVLVAQAKQLLTDVSVVRHDVSLNRALIDLEGQWFGYRIVVSEIHRADSSMRYAYYVLGNDNQLVHGFDNSPDARAIRQRYKARWKSHIHEEVPHRHDANRNLVLTPEPMTFEAFVEWITQNLGETK